MKKIRIFTIACGIFWICSIANAQNLFPNPDFEEYNDCPTSFSGINTNKCSDWTCIAGSADYFNCSFYGSTGTSAGAIFGVPSSGSGVIGMSGLINNLFCEGELQRESISATLIEPLNTCYEYRISFDIRLDKTGMASIPGFGHDCLDFGFYFFSGQDPNSCSNSCDCWNVEPQIRISSVEIPEDDYATFTFDFLAEGNFDKVAVGPFCSENMNSPECYAPPDNRGPFELYFNLDNLFLEHIIKTYEIGISTNTICQNEDIFLWENHSDSINNWNWNIPGAFQNSPDGQIVSFSFPNPGEYSVELITQSSCDVDTVQLTNYIQVNPIYEMTYSDTSTTICEDAIFSIPNPISGLAYKWSDYFTGTARQFESSGVYTINVTDNFGCHSDSFDVNVELVNEMAIFPNPTNTIWGTNNPISFPNTIQLYDAAGRMIYTIENVNELEIDIKMLNLSSGIYFLIVEVNDCRINKKVICAR